MESVLKPSKLDESTARRQLKSPGHYLVDPYTWPWSPNGHGHQWPTATPFVQCQSALPFWDTAFQHLTMKIHGQGHVCGQRSRSCLTLKIQRSRLCSRSNLMVTFEALEFYQYVCFSFRGNLTFFGWDIANSIFDLEKSRSRSWPRSNPMVTFEP